MNAKLPKRPASFDEALEAYLYFWVDESLVSSEYRTAVWEANPNGYGITPQFRDELWRLVIAFAIKERGQCP